MKKQLQLCKPSWRMYLLHCKVNGLTACKIDNLNNWLLGN